MLLPCCFMFYKKQKEISIFPKPIIIWYFCTLCWVMQVLLPIFNLQGRYVNIVNLRLVASAWKCTYSHFTICPMTKNKMVILTHPLILCTVLPPLLVFRVESEVSRERDSQIFWKFRKIFCTHFLVLSVSDMLLMMVE